MPTHTFLLKAMEPGVGYLACNRKYVFDSAPEKAYKGKRKITGTEVLGL